MIVIIILSIVLVLGVGFFFLSGLSFEYYTQYIYDEKGDLVEYGHDIENYQKLGLKCYGEYPCRKETFRRLEFTGNHEWGMGISGTIAVVALIADIWCGIHCAVEHGQLHAAENQLWWEVEVDKLAKREDTLRLYLAGDLNLEVEVETTTYHVIVDKPIEMKNEIDAYNNDIMDLKQHLFKNKLYITSPWTNWFMNPGFTKLEHYNKNATSYRDILGDTLKTFELVAKN